MEITIHYPKVKIENKNGNLFIGVFDKHGVQIGGGPIVNGTVSEGFKPLDFSGMIKSLIDDHSFEIPLQYLYFGNIGDDSAKEPFIDKDSVQKVCSGIFQMLANE